MTLCQTDGDIGEVSERSFPSFVTRATFEADAREDATACFESDGSRGSTLGKWWSEWLLTNREENTNKDKHTWKIHF